ncbi:DUF2589 domain-containing protein [Pseudomonas defluvii]|jgi:hypothetical protein|uniref:DUF2589 domain-containing protein n=1 Tax=Pseudomonas TaxID=286 RepID=UPI0008116357|nr:MULTISPECIES: DUF2589 domain-containing protein [Pseudomonas]ATR83870.1 DUF2589 domain-containing protein [Pseudomonas sp. HLS-6]MEE3636300.1 DUF2589 domain-containing protein [Pseudomonas sp. AL 58]WJM95880.1 DUF2589 domain-containing protein [Pseudomonas defluvii]
MATIDNSLIGSVMNALPLDRMISGPLQAMIQAQVSASKSYADFLMGVCIQDGKAVAIQFDYEETLTDEQGVYQGTVAKKMQIPLLAAITHPNIAIEEGNIEFELTISQQAESSSETGGSAEFGASIGWGPFKMSVKGQVSHKSTQTRKTDTRARYAFNTRVKRQDPPEALMRVIDFLTDAATKPVMLPNTEAQNKDALPESKLPMPDQVQQTTN